MTLWRRLVGDRPIVTRLVLAVTGAMTVVLLAGGAFVFWRVQYALNRQLDQDLTAYSEVVQKAVATGSLPPTDTPGQSYQVYDAAGRIVDGNATQRLADRQSVSDTMAGLSQRADVGRLIPPAAHPYRFVTAHVTSPTGPVVVASAISRRKHDEALRELLLQLAIADAVTLAAASIVGYGTARAALNPVERYRQAAANADASLSLPVPEGKDDEVVRLGRTFNALLRRIDAANQRERQFLADASHELRSPLALMRTELEVASLTRQSESAQEATYASLRQQVERLIAVSNALLDLEELRATSEGTVASNGGRAPVDVPVLVRDIAERFAAQPMAEGRPIVVTAPDELLMTGHERWLDLAVSNLVTNALRHGTGTVRVIVRSAATDNGQDGPRNVLVAVTDDGDGFPPEFVDQAFNRFSRAELSRTTRGTGLGLALVQAVAEAHGGDARIDGARVTLRFPDAATPEGS